MGEGVGNKDNVLNIPDTHLQENYANSILCRGGLTILTVEWWW